MNISLIWQSMYFKKNSKGRISTLSVLSISILKPGIFFTKFLTKVVWKLEKLKCQNFKKMYVQRPGNRRHSFFITWIFYQPTNLFPVKPNIWYLRSLEKLAIKMQFRTKFKGPLFCGWWVKELETFTKHLFWC